MYFNSRYSNPRSVFLTVGCSFGAHVAFFALVFGLGFIPWHPPRIIQIGKISIVDLPPGLGTAQPNEKKKGVDRVLDPKNASPAPPKQVAKRVAEPPKPAAAPKATPQPLAQSTPIPAPKPAATPLPAPRTDRKVLSTAASEMKKAVSTPTPALPPPRSAVKKAEDTKTKVPASPRISKDEEVDPFTPAQAAGPLPSAAVPSDLPVVQAKGDPDGKAGGPAGGGLQFDGDIVLPAGYAADARGYFQQNFIYPKYLDERPIVFCTVRFKIRMDGSIYEPEVVQSTGTGSLDQFAIDAVTHTQLPALPETIKRDFIGASLVFSFGQAAPAP